MNQPLFYSEKAAQIQKAKYYLKYERCCVYCETRITFGRSDKKFCDISCKNGYHKSVNKEVAEANAEINEGLRRNSVVLREVIGPKRTKTKVKVRDLVRRNFDFNLCTGYKNNQFGTMNYVYQFYWFERPNNRIEIRIDPDMPPIGDLLFRRWEADQKAKGLL